MQHCVHVYLCIYFVIFIIRLGSACSHVAAVLACAQLGMNKKVCTSKLFQWNVSRRKADPVSLQMSFKRPRKGDLPEVLDPFEDPEPFSFKDSLLNNVFEKRKKKTAELRSIVPKAVVFTSISKFVPKKIDNSDLVTADEDETNSLPEPLTSLYDPLAINWSEEDIKTMGKKIYERYIRSHRPYQFENLCNVTRTQSLNPNWKLHRAEKIAASQALNAYRCDISNLSITFINTIMQYITVPNVKAVKYGREHKGLARTCYENLQKCRHTNFKIQLTGLHNDARFPALRASSDASCDCHGMEVLGIKCPEKYMNGLFNWQKDKKFPVTKTYEIKRNHPYWTRTQNHLVLKRTLNHLAKLAK